MSNIILVGHSMGGLISKMQVTSSGNRLWSAIADQPFDQVTMLPHYRRELSQYFFFGPSPDIRRVVFVGTPHQGSGYAQRLIGRLASVLVTLPEDERAKHRHLIRSNPGVFSRQVTRRVPTSIDLLNPRSDMLQAIGKLPARCGVVMHSIIGDSNWGPCTGRSDGVVPVTSAQEPRAVSERLIDASHTNQTDHPDTIAEVLRILRIHQQTLAESMPLPSFPVELAVPQQDAQSASLRVEDISLPVSDDGRGD